MNLALAIPLVFTAAATGYLLGHALGRRQGISLGWNAGRSFEQLAPQLRHSLAEYRERMARIAGSN